MQAPPASPVSAYSNDDAVGAVCDRAISLILRKSAVIDRAYKRYEETRLTTPYCRSCKCIKERQPQHWLGRFAREAETH